MSRAPVAETLPARPLPFLLRYLRLRPWHFGALLALVAGAAACAVSVQYAMKLIIDAMTAQDRATADVFSPLGLFLALIAVESVLWRSAGILGARSVVATSVDVRLDLFRHLSGHSMRFFNEHFSGALGNRITAASQSIGQIFNTFTWSILPPITDFVGAIVVFSTIRGEMALALCGFVIVVGGIVLRFGARGKPLHQLYAEEGARVNGELVDVVSNVWTVKAFAARKLEHARLARELGVEATAYRRSWLHMEKMRVLHDLCLWLMAGGMLTWAIMAWRSGGITSGDVVVISALSFRILHGSRDLAFALIGVSQQFGAIGETLKVIAQPHALADPAHGQDFAPQGGAVEFQQVSYRHPGGQQVFERFDLKVLAGQRVGVVGASGAGKSTLIALLQRLDDVQQGCILIDGQALTEVTQDSLRERIAVVPQDIALFNRSIRENIRYGCPEASDAQVEAAARHAFCDGFIRELPMGYDTMVGERGVRLSGGQRQRLGIARAFLKNAPILILDEATSALDTQSELEIQLALSQLMRGRTVIAVAHRLSTLSGFDRVIVLEGGRLIEDGPPDELRRRSGGVFAEMWRLQADGFVPDPQLRKTA